MRSQLVDKTIAWFALVCGLAISSVAIWFSVAGLVAIFAAAAIPIIIMGGVLEVGKLVATVWLKFNWDRAPFFLKSYLLSAIIILMFITSMGIFGYLSKAHIEQTLPTSDAVAQIEIIDSRIELQQDIIEQARQEITILNNQIQEYTERGFVTRGVEARAAQSEERERLLNQISTSQQAIADLRNDRAPYAQVVRTIEAEVGPLKYIAAVIYGNDVNADLLEQAVRWVIIILIFVFDPLAVLLLLASQVTFIQLRKERRVDESDGEPGITHFKPLTVSVVKHPRRRCTDKHGPQHVDQEEIDRTLEVPSDALDSVVPDSTNVEELIDIIEQKEYVPDEEIIPVDWASADNEILAAASDDERRAMLMWKTKDDSNYLTQQYLLLEEGTIKELPWSEYITPLNQKKR